VITVMERRSILSKPVVGIATGIGQARRTPGELERMDEIIVLCAANAYDTFKLADQHLAESLCRLTPVLYVDPPLSRLTPARNPAMASSLCGPRLRMITDNLARLTPVVQPRPSRPGMPPVTAALARRHLTRAVSALGARVRAVVSAWPQYQVFGVCGEQTRVYWAQDDYVGGAALMGLRPGQVDRLERRVAAAADFVIASSLVVADIWRTRGLDVTLIPNGADVAAYVGVDQADLPPDVDLPGPVAGFVGQINERTDLGLLEAVAARGRSLLLVGPVRPGFETRRLAALTGRPNVCWVGPKPFGALPGYLRLIDVGLVPYHDSAFNRGSFPLKTLEYLAAGRAVVATDLPAIRWLSTDLVVTATTAEAFADKVDGSLTETRSPTLAARRVQFAAQHSWAKRADSFYNTVLATGRPAGTQPDFGTDGQQR
jgi:teichuronic acid biosynthesis glycosyltransferase TuaH